MRSFCLKTPGGDYNRGKKMLFKTFAATKGGFISTSPSWLSVTNFSSQCSWTRMAWLNVISSDVILLNLKIDRIRIGLLFQVTHHIKIFWTDCELIPELTISQCNWKGNKKGKGTDETPLIVNKNRNSLSDIFICTKNERKYFCISALKRSLY